MFDFIFDNLFWIIAAIVFISGFRKSKKKKDRPTKPTPNPYEEQFPGSEEEPYLQWDDSDEWKKNRPWDDDPWEETNKKKESPWKPVENLPLPESIKEMIETLDSGESRHYDAPWSGEGKENAHQEVVPTVTPSAVTSRESGKGKNAQSTPKPTVAVAPDVSDADTDAYALPKVRSVAITPQIMAEAVVWSEILGKPKALRRRVE